MDTNTITITLIEEEKQCWVCSEINTFSRVEAGQSHGLRDLDTRLGGTFRTTINHWTQRCPNCGYCAPDIAQGPDRAGEISRSPAYLYRLADPTYPALANNFLSWAFLQEACGDLVEAGWACVHAAWVCDDEGSDMGANMCRMKAIELFLRARRNRQRFVEETGAEDALLADLYRRSGEFERSVTMVQVGLLKKPGERLRQILYYQVELVKQRDIACHTEAEALQSLLSE